MFGKLFSKRRKSSIGSAVSFNSVPSVKMNNSSNSNGNLSKNDSEIPTQQKQHSFSNHLKYHRLSFDKRSFVTMLCESDLYAEFKTCIDGYKNQFYCIEEFTKLESQVISTIQEQNQDAMSIPTITGTTASVSDAGTNIYTVGNLSGVQQNSVAADDGINGNVNGSAPAPANNTGVFYGVASSPTTTNTANQLNNHFYSTTTNPLPPSLLRFLDKSSSILTEAKPIFIPEHLAPAFQMFFSKYFEPSRETTAFKILLPEFLMDEVRKTFIEKGQSGLSLSVFDNVIDFILEDIYGLAFPTYLNARSKANTPDMTRAGTTKENDGLQPTSIMMTNPDANTNGWNNNKNSTTGSILEANTNIISPNSNITSNSNSGSNLSQVNNPGLIQQNDGSIDPNNYHQEIAPSSSSISDKSITSSIGKKDKSSNKSKATAPSTLAHIRQVPTPGYGNQNFAGMSATHNNPHSNSNSNLGLDSSSRAASARKNRSNKNNDNTIGSTESVNRRKSVNSVHTTNTSSNVEPMLEPSYQFTKECFVQVLMNKKRYGELKKFAEIDLCTENFLFIEEMKKFESKISTVKFERFSKKSNAPPKYLQKFLQDSTLENGGNNSSGMNNSNSINNYHANMMNTSMSNLSLSASTSSQHGSLGLNGEVKEKQDVSFIPVPLMSICFGIYHQFIAPGATSEINITSPQRKKLSELLGMKNRVPVTVFDEVTELVLTLIYQNTFRRFVEQQKNYAGK